MSLTSGNLAQLLVEQVLHSPDQFEILQEERRITYSQLDFYSRQVAHQLSSQSLPCEGVVGILTSLGVEHIIAQVGILYAGGTVLPLDPNLSNEEIQMRLRVVNAEYFISDSHNAGRCSLQHTVILAGGKALFTSAWNEMECRVFEVVNSLPDPRQAILY
ncbi:hypothetical protein GYMLUDRAFT_249090 [Collybiopsis luxurians FD-317 M1]|uniref:Unplaced genomic scaffold GYMLUscaffold_63, whole genome shotgun sequence n=1 Tax=Collybiopsis luxurians FD-317 M1 TaxID=944289 RepID=A0A0D0CIT8_9AGAR|nr:hypothetical protein GYMLUDRAFT_249090 [Collybiopsis luxurians FD-317 M1]